MPVNYEESERMLSQFNKLITELLKGTLSRNTFRPWEVDILLDIEHCNLKDGNKRETLRRYQKPAVDPVSPKVLAEIGRDCDGVVAAWGH